MDIGGLEGFLGAVLLAVATGCTVFAYQRPAQYPKLGGLLAIASFGVALCVTLFQTGRGSMFTDLAPLMAESELDQAQNLVAELGETLARLAFILMGFGVFAVGIGWLMEWVKPDSTSPPDNERDT